MKMLYIAPGMMPEMTETNDPERTLGDRVERIHPFLDENICLAALLDRDDRKKCLTLLDEDAYELDSVRGPVLFFREDEEDLTEDDLDYIENRIRCYEQTPEEPIQADEETDDDDGPDDESFSPIHIVDGITFGEMLRNERTEEQRYF